MVIPPRTPRPELMNGTSMIVCISKAESAWPGAVSPHWVMLLDWCVVTTHPIEVFLCEIGVEMLPECPHAVRKCFQPAENKHIYFACIYCALVLSSSHCPRS